MQKVSNKITLDRPSGEKVRQKKKKISHRQLRSFAWEPMPFSALSRQWFKPKIS